MKEQIAMNTKLKSIMKDMTPRYTIKLPISNLTVKYRPFLVKEEKLMVKAMNDDNADTMKSQYTMIKKLLQNCTDIKDVDDLPVCEIELMFLKLRSKSMANNVTLNHTVEGRAKPIKLKLDLDTVNIEGELPEPKLMIDANIGIVVAPPTLGNLLSVEVSDGDSSGFDEIFSLIKSSIIEIFTEDKIIKTQELSSGELDEFVENLPTLFMEKMTAYFDNLPKLKKDVEYTSGNKTQTITLIGINDFIQ